MTSSLQKKIGIIVVAVLLIAAIAYVFMTPYNRTPGVRLGGIATEAPADWSRVNDVREMQLKPDGFPPFVVNIWYVGTSAGIITATRPDNGYWGRRVRGNSNAHVRIGDAAYSVRAREVTEPTERNRMIQAYVDKYNLESVPGMSFAELSDPAMPWEVFFWTPR